MEQIELATYLQSFGVLTPEEIDYLVRLGKRKWFEKGELFQREGEIVHEVAFVSSGMFRSFYHSSLDEEVTYCFLFPGNLMAGYSSYITGNPTSESMEALIPSEVFLFPVSELKALEEKSINWMKCSKIIAEQQYLLMEERVFQLQKEKAETRYQNLMQKHPDYIREIPLRYLASYLGVTQRHLSRLRGQW